ncbi:hypothetical protein ACFL21_03035 [Patescibacteria group bacterium]
MISKIAYFMILGKPLIMWGGIATLILLIVTVILSKKDRKMHKILATITFIIALMHGILGILLNF